ncbi:hypothetical protein SBOR_1693 [Sclerotinia borealis F-4128]|uniref:Uncharacterized protein n=1 Tax=Sclerotinia borealis (strain F-4128) TaxID=1432307 RepID=W9CPH0_SCLBF|nr:hypothetical protein SBOR_1693 [Sclerotinia borealis F-4128]
MGWFDGASESGRSHSSRKHSSHSHSGKKHRSSTHSTHSTHPNNASGILESIGGGGGNTSPKSSHSHRERSRSRTRGSGSVYGSGDAKQNSSRGSFFGPNFNSHSHSTSHYKRSPRPNYLKRIYHKLRQLLRDLIYYMKRHPMKVFMLVIMPLITGGALAGLLKKFGVRLPGGLEKLIGGGKGGNGNGSGKSRFWGGNGGRDAAYEFEKSTGSVKGSGGAMGKLGMLAGGMESVGGAMKLVKLFL